MKFSEMPYERIDKDQMESDFLKLMEEFDQAKSGEEQFEIHKKYYKLKDNVETFYNLAQIRSDIDTKDEYYEEEYNYYDEMIPSFTNLVAKYQKKLYESPYKDYLMDQIGKVAFKNIELVIKSNGDQLIPYMQEENALISKYNRLIAGAEIEFNGEILNLSLLRKFLTDKDREVRRKAHAKRTEFFLSIADQLDDIFDKLVKNRTEQAKVMGYENYVELGYARVNRNSYDKDMVRAFREQVKTSIVPVVAKMQEKRKEALGVEKLTYIDEEVFFQNGNPEPIGTPEEIMAAGKKMYGELSEETKEFFDFMTEHELFDVLGRKTKKAGGYMTSLENYKAPFIFANFNGTSGDVDVMTHECGHAFQGYLTRDYKIKEHKDITMETAEIHSMSMEFFTEPWMNLFFGERTEDYLKMHLDESIIFLPYGCMVDEFQHIVYENPDMTPEERNKTWSDLEKVYRPYLDFEDDQFFGKGKLWQKQQHIYNNPFYYIDYCLASICALQFKVAMDKDYKEAWKNYLSLCKASASGFFVDMIQEVGLKSPFVNGTVEEIMNSIETKLDL